MALRDGLPVLEWVFVNKKGEMLNRIVVTKALQKCLELVGLRNIRVHDLRYLCHHKASEGP